MLYRRGRCSGLLSWVWVCHQLQLIGRRVLQRHSADVIVHFGSACGSLPSHIPVVFAFDSVLVDADSAACTASVSEEVNRSPGASSVARFHVLGDECCTEVLPSVAASLKDACFDRQVLVHPAVGAAVLVDSLDSAAVRLACAAVQLIAPVATPVVEHMSDHVVSIADGDAIVFIGVEVSLSLMCFCLQRLTHDDAFHDLVLHRFS
jgi:hypothetical protein